MNEERPQSPGTGKPGGPRRVLPIACLLLLAGCEGLQNAVELDPLTGEGRPLPRGGATAVPPPPVPAGGSQTGAAGTGWTPPPGGSGAPTGTGSGQTPGALASATTSTTPTTPAGLATMDNRAAGEPRPDPRAAGPSGATGWRTAPGSTATPGGSVSRAPEASDATRAAPGNVTLTGGSQRVENVEQLQAILDSYGVSWQRADRTGPSDWKFTCAIPVPQKPNLETQYEGRGGSEAAAIRAALDLIARQRGN